MSDFIYYIMAIVFLAWVAVASALLIVAVPLAMVRYLLGIGPAKGRATKRIKPELDAAAIERAAMAAQWRYDNLWKGK